MSICFTKMHGLGNDFMVVDAIRQHIHFLPEQISAWSQRHTGIGFDQCLIIEASNVEGIDFFYRIYNADGQEIGQCGNGARCLARFVQHYGLTDKQSIVVKTNTTTMTLHLHSDKTVSVELPSPKLAPHDIPLLAKKESDVYLIPGPQQEAFYVHAVNVGNPHAILLMDSLNQDISHIGKIICEHAYFPEQTNVGFMQIISPNMINLRVYERGAGETQACGSGAVAAVVAGRLFHQLASTVTVNLPGGSLQIHWPSLSDNITLTGPATFVYEGHIGISGHG